MSPLDDELAAALRARAGRLDAPADPLPAVERRAGRLRTRRRAAAGLGAAAVLGLVGVVGVTSGVLGGGGADRLASPTASSAAPEAGAARDATAAGEPVPVEPPGAESGCCADGQPPGDGPDLGLIAAEPWPLRGDADVAAALTDPLLAEWADAAGLPGVAAGTDAAPLFAADVPGTRDRALLALVRPPGAPAEVVLLTLGPAGGPSVDRRPLEAGDPVLARVLGGGGAGETPVLLLLSSPAAGQVDYLPDGATPAEPVTAGPGFGLFAWEPGGEGTALVRVYDGDGRLVVDTSPRLGCAEGACGREPAG